MELRLPGTRKTKNEEKTRYDSPPAPTPPFNSQRTLEVYEESGSHGASFLLLWVDLLGTERLSQSLGNPTLKTQDPP